MAHPYTRLFTGASAPTVNDDISLGYEVGDLWLTSTTAYQCLDTTDGAAVWLNTGNAAFVIHSLTALGGTLTTTDEIPIARASDSYNPKRITFTELINSIDLDGHFATANRGVTNGSAHDHVGGDGSNLLFYLPFAAYTSISPITVGGGAPYSATIPASMTFVKWSQAVFTLGAAHDASNYYTMTLKLRQGAPAADVTIASLNTQTLGSSTQLTLSTTTFTTGSVTGTGYIYMLMAKTGTPADLYVISPTFQCVLT